MYNEAEHNVGDVFFYDKKQLYMVVIDKSFVGRVSRGSKSKIKGEQIEVNEWLYVCAYLTETKEIRSYYESRLSCLRLMDTDAPFIKTIISLYEPTKRKKVS